MASASPRAAATAPHRDRTRPVLGPVRQRRHAKTGGDLREAVSPADQVEVHWLGPDSRRHYERSRQGLRRCRGWRRSQRLGRAAYLPAGFECDCSSGWHRLGAAVSIQAFDGAVSRCHATVPGHCCRRASSPTSALRCGWRRPFPHTLCPSHGRALWPAHQPTGEPRAAHLAGDRRRVDAHTASPRSTGAAGW